MAGTGFENDSAKKIFLHMLLAFFSLFANGFGVYLTIHANIGSAPWDVLNLGLSNTLGILYGTASIAVSVIILTIDVIMREPLGLAMIIDSLTVGKSVDFFNALDFVPEPKNIADSICMMLLGLVIVGYTQYFYMKAALGCGPRDTLMVGVSRRIKKIPIGVIGIIIQGTATGIGYLLGGPVGIGTIICAFMAGPIMELAFKTARFDATGVEHQNILESIKILFKRNKKSGHGA